MQDLSQLPTIEFAYELIVESPRRVWTDRQKLWSVYMIRNILNGRVYIGRTTNPKSRAMQHFASIRRRDHANITDYDGEFKFEILANKLKWDEASAKELFYMKTFKSYDERFGYNTKDNHFYHKGNPTKNLKKVN